MAPARLPVDIDALCAALVAGGKIETWARENGLSPGTVHARLASTPGARERTQAARAQAKATNGKDHGANAGPSLVVPEGRLRDLKLGEIKVLLAENQLDPDQWTVDRATVNKWGQPGEESRQVKVQLRPKTWLDTLTPANIRPPVKLGKPRRPAAGEPQLIIAHGDDHAPYHDQALHEAFCRFLGDVQPHAVVHLGDGLDFPTISRHNDDPSHNATPQACIDGFYGLLVDRRAASPDSAWWMIPGNHDDRIRTELLARAERMYGITPAPTKDDPDPLAAMSLRNLLHLDALGITLAETDEGSYFHGRVEFGDTLEFVHGHFTGPTATRKHVERGGRNIVHGHTHDQHTEYVKRHLYGAEATLVAVAAGPMCHTDRRGASYAPSVDWHAGFAAVYLWPDGHVEASHARWDGGLLRWQGKTW